MKYTHQRKALLLIILGIFIISVSQIINHYIQIPDFINGISKGVGIGMLAMVIIKLIRPKKTTPA